MKILLITDEEWNDAVYGNNVLTNWFQGFDAEFAHIYCSPGLPYNSCCEHYFRITDSEMLRSILPWKKKAGGVILKPGTQEEIDKSKQNAQREGKYRWLKEMSLYVHTPMMIIRDLIWLCGRYNNKRLKEFIDDFKPDVIFMPRMATPKFLRLERIVHELCDVPMVAFTGDNEVELGMLHKIPHSLTEWRKKYTRRMFESNSSFYSHYFAHSAFQADYYHKHFGINTSCLYKCGDFKEAYFDKQINTPIQLIYAGKLYCNRWKTLATVGAALEQINHADVKAELYIYTQDKLDSEQNKTFSALHHVKMMGSVTPEQLEVIYQKGDIALHVESFDEPYKSLVRHSFSTKIIDLMGSSCAVMAICPPDQTGWVYLQRNDAAFCASNEEEINVLLKKIVGNLSLISQYARKAWSCGKDNHSREKIQNQLMETFKAVIEKHHG